VFDSGKNAYQIVQGVDPQKDQSYVLFPLDQNVLSRLELPVGRYAKSEIREIARTLDLVVADKPDSQEICFIPSNQYGTFLERELTLPENKGMVEDRYGNVLGQHKGYYHYTIGQRSGLNIPFKHALYVVDIVPEKNLVVVGGKEDVFGQGCHVEKVNWLIHLNGTRHFRAAVKIRSRHQKTWADLEITSPSSVRVQFDEPQEAITPGQACVFYDGEHVLGGGWIAKNANGQHHSNPTEPVTLNPV
ncbi:MAG: tRNA 2-thiouridine(34) synthase MnmA, partial [Candidatus Omnitrophica bacterium]|nr:tRNA 2-thiouridine(34) synthase MnmA [Candidatus Omnitrophota bacterium]